MANGYDMNTNNLPYAFSKVQELAELPPEVSGLAMYDMLYDDMRLEESIEDHWGYGSEDAPLDYEDIEDRDPYALEKAMYQQQIQSVSGVPPALTPYGPSLEDPEVEAMLNAYPGADAIKDDFNGYVDGWDSHFNDVESMLTASGTEFDDMVEAGNELAVKTGTLDRINDIYNVMGNDMANEIETNMEYNPDRDIIQADQIYAAGMFPNWSWNDIVSGVTGAAESVTSFVKNQVTNIGETILGGQDPFTGMGTDPLAMIGMSMFDRAEDNSLYESYLNEYGQEGPDAFMKSMETSSPQGWGTVEAYLSFINRAVLSGDMSETAGGDLRLALSRIEADQKFVQGGSTSQNNATTDYEVTRSGPSSPEVLGGGGISAQDISTFGYGDTGFGGEIPRTDPARELRPDEREIRINDLIQEGATREGANYIVNEALSPNTMENALALNYIMSGMSPVDAWVMVEESDLPVDPTAGAGGPLSIGEFEKQQEDYAKLIAGEQAQSEAAGEDGQAESRQNEQFTRLQEIQKKFGINSAEAKYFEANGYLPGENLSDAYSGLIGDDYSSIFTQKWNLIPKSDQWRAREVYPIAYNDVDTLYHLQRDLNETGLFDAEDVGYQNLDINESLWQKLADHRSGATVLDQAELDDLEAQKAKELDDYSGYAGRYFADPSMRYSPDFYQDARDLRDSMWRFTGNPVDPAFDQRLRAAWDPKMGYEGQAPGWLPPLDIAGNPIVPYEDEDITDTLWKRYNFMNSEDGQATRRLANLAALYNMNPGADRYEQKKMTGMMTQLLNDWIRAGKSTESFLQTYIGNKPGRGTWGDTNTSN